MYTTSYHAMQRVVCMVVVKIYRTDHRWHSTKK